MGLAWFGNTDWYDDRRPFETERRGALFIEESALKHAVMTPEQQALAQQGVCPKCSGALLAAHEGEGMSFNQCKRCKDVWVLPANA